MRLSEDHLPANTANRDRLVARLRSCLGKGCKRRSPMTTDLIQWSCWRSRRELSRVRWQLSSRRSKRTCATISGNLSEGCSTESEVPTLPWLSSTWHCGQGYSVFQLDADKSECLSRAGSESATGSGNIGLAVPTHQADSGITQRSHYLGNAAASHL